MKAEKPELVSKKPAEVRFSFFALSMTETIESTLFPGENSAVLL